jgi:aspartyl-tRNA(Asn)/glutamyl-tRNA(Gln) amidotransferase subunit B
MEEGSLRVDGNVSLRPAGSEELGTKTELKNMNSFRFLERGIEAEIERQRELIESGQEVEQETLHFHPDDGSLTSMRSKEYAHDYRYFPEPDLVPVVPTEEMREAARAALPELPAARKERYLNELDLPEATAASLAFQPELGGFFEDALAAESDATPRAIANWVTGDLVAALREQDLGEDPNRSKAEPGEIAALAAMVEGKQVSHSAGKQVLVKLAAEGGTAAGLVESEGLAQISDDSEIDAMIDAAIESEPEAADQVRSGNEKAIGRIVGAAMKNSQGRIDGGLAREKILERLG